MGEKLHLEKFTRDHNDGVIDQLNLSRSIPSVGFNCMSCQYNEKLEVIFLKSNLALNR